ncbi:hypothetical protein B0H63DRAFT_445967 [Podospora didyma]|uniref:SUR7 protein n=1 Tax=Podospora didyma TaxID=330526 RepID=A0AAE0NYK5_9PEZI|nr:hypothetical protein B0H63DRAFT_445967 [Podospora didyma]
MAGAGRMCIGILPSIFMSLSFIMILILVLPGVNNSITQIYFLKTETSGLSAPPKLGNSDFLRDLSTVSGTDFVGQKTTAADLGLADSYTVHLLTVCGHFSGGSVSCSTPRINFAFDPSLDLKLDRTSLQGTYSQSYLDALSNYSRINHFLPGGYIAAAVFIWLAPLAACFSAVGATILSSLAAILLLSSSIAAGLTFKNMNNAFNDNFNASGLSSSIGTIPIALSVIPLVFCLIATGFYVAQARSSSAKARRRGGVVARSVGGKEAEAYGPYGPYGPYAAGAHGGDGVWNRGQHKYAKVEAGQDATDQREAMLAQSSSPSPDMRPKRLDDDWAAPDDYAQSKGTAAAPGPSDPAAVPFISLGGNKPTKDLNTAYEPYSGTGTAH